MIQLGAWLIGVGLTDLVAGPSGEVDRAQPVRLAIGAAAGVIAGGVYGLAGGDLTACVRIAIITAATAWPWLELRMPAGERSRVARRATAALWVLAVGLLVASASSALWADPFGGGVLRDGLGSLPIALLAGSPPERVVLVAGLLLFLAGTSNAIVRSVLLIIGTRLKPMEERCALFALVLAA